MASSCNAIVYIKVKKEATPALLADTSGNPPQLTSLSASYFILCFHYAPHPLQPVQLPAQPVPRPAEEAGFPKWQTPSYARSAFSPHASQRTDSIASADINCSNNTPQALQRNFNNGMLCLSFPTLTSFYGNNIGYSIHGRKKEGKNTHDKRHDKRTNEESVNKTSPF